MRTAAALVLALAPAALWAQPSPANQGIVFVGSSIFRLWTGLTEQMAPLPVLNRAVSGSVTENMVAGADGMVLAYQPRIVVYYCGSNDVNRGDSAEEIVARTKQFMTLVHARLPDTMIFYTAIQKSPDKRARWNVVDAVNREMERYSHSMKNIGFIDLNPVLFDRQGRVREDLFLPDQLHFRPDSTAYPEFAAVVKPVLLKAWANLTAPPSRQ